MKRTLVIVVAVVVLLLALTAVVVSSQAASAAGPIEVGTAGGGVNAVEYIGRVDQVGGSFVSYGYLTHISGLADTVLFSGTVLTGNSEANAYFTFYTTATLTAHYVISGISTTVGSPLTSNVFVIDSIGTTVYYYNVTPGATFTDPLSFAAGTPIMTATVRSQNILNVQAANVGVGTNFAEFTQMGASPFTLNGITYQLGRAGVLERLFSTGQGIRTDPLTPKSFTIVAGNAVVTNPGPSTFAPVVMRNAP